MRRSVPSASERGGPARRGFTLAEVLVSLAVVALVASMLLPGLAGARESARRAACLSNQRQLGAAVWAYGGEFRGVAPPAASQSLRNLDRWHGRRERVSEAFAPGGGALSAYMGEEGGAAIGARACPSFAGTLALLTPGGAGGGAGGGWGFERSCGGYGYNARYVGEWRVRGSSGLWIRRSDRRGACLDAFADPAGTVLFADAGLEYPGAPEGVIEYSFIEPRWWPDLPGHRPDPSMHFRHGGTSGRAGECAAVMLDGHARGFRRGLAWSSGIYGESAADPRTGWADGACGADDNGLFDYE